jgi:hypothetical protein
MRTLRIGALSLLAACGDAGDVTTTGTGGPGSTGSTGGATTGGVTGEPAPTSGGATTGGSTGAGETTGAPGPTSGEATSTGGEVDPHDPLQARRGALHVHSPYSHDACDGDGLTDDAPNPGCLADLRAAMCSSGYDFVLLTDHPAHMQAHTMTEDLLHAGGDELLPDGDAPRVNRVACGGERSVLVAVGYESTHTLPLGLHHHVAPEHYAGLTDDVPLADATALVAALQAAGAVVAVAHSEEADLSAQRIIDVGLDAMEWYNPHGNFKTVLGGDSISGNPGAVLELLQALLPFMAGADSGAHADLVVLQLLPSWPQAGFDKWREVQRARAVTGLLGSDVHQNVSVAPLCSEDEPLLQAACVAAAHAVLPTQLDSLATGGTLQMSDGDRLDSFARIFRWLENRVLTPPGELDLAALQDALRAGRSYGLFAVFGEPEGLRFFGADAADAYLGIGDQAAGPLRLELRAPARALPLHADGPQWGDADAANAEVRLELWHTGADGSALALQVEGLGAAASHAASAPGAYHLEVWVRPKHLAPALGDQQPLADAWYLWAITNPIRVL